MMSSLPVAGGDAAATFNLDDSHIINSSEKTRTVQRRVAAADVEKQRQR